MIFIKYKLNKTNILDILRYYDKNVLIKLYITFYRHKMFIECNI